MSLTSRAYGERGRRRAIKQGIDPERLPPGQSPTAPGKWPVLTVGAAPVVGPEDWKLFVYGEVTESMSFTLADLRPRAVEQVCDIHCVTRWSRFDMRWEGARVRELLEPTPRATHALIHSYGGYSTNLPLDALLDDDVLVAWAADGQPLAHEHGGPVRLLARSATSGRRRSTCRRSSSSTTTSRICPARPLNGYHNDGDPWREERTNVDPFAFRALRRRARGVSRP
jgi:DMSO/TMAO reductase YedYZ molybdopterin-dependent catalytic subunit